MTRGIIGYLDGLWALVHPGSAGLDDRLINPEVDPRIAGLQITTQITVGNILSSISTMVQTSLHLNYSPPPCCSETTMDDDETAFPLLSAAATLGPTAQLPPPPPPPLLLLLLLPVSVTELFSDTGFFIRPAWLISLPGVGLSGSTAYPDDLQQKCKRQYDMKGSLVIWKLRYVTRTMIKRLEKGRRKIFEKRVYKKKESHERNNPDVGQHGNSWSCFNVFDSLLSQPMQRLDK
ncbi:hypothetical protein LXL04_005651 [Taraxacum kok-saghyz]